MGGRERREGEKGAILYRNSDMFVSWNAWNGFCMMGKKTLPLVITISLFFPTKGFWPWLLEFCHS